MRLLLGCSVGREMSLLGTSVSMEIIQSLKKILALSVLLCLVLEMER